MSDLESVFQHIADINHWGNAESMSGDGSTLDYTYNLRHELAKFVRGFEIRSMFDAPCGDFNWMHAVNLPESFAYVGGDIVPTLIELQIRRNSGALGANSVFSTSRRIGFLPPISGSVATACSTCRSIPFSLHCGGSANRKSRIL